MTAKISKRCIIADDVRASREMIGCWLTDYGFDCSLAANGEVAKHAAEKYHPDLIITDIEMPKCNGLQLLTAIRGHANPAIRNIPVIVVSSLQDDDLVELVGQLGASKILCKPLEKQLVISVVTLITNDACSPIKLNRLPVSERANISPKLRRLLEQGVEKN